MAREEKKKIHCEEEYKDKKEEECNQEKISLALTFDE